MCAVKERPGFMLYFELVPALSTMDDVEAGLLFKALMAYAQYGEVRPLTGLSAFAFQVIRPRIDKDAENYAEKCRKSAYAAYVRDTQRRQETPLEYEVWCSQLSDDIGRYPTTTTTTTTTATAASAEGSTGRAAAEPPPVEYGEFLFSPQVKAAIEEWLRYKAERREQYTATGLRSLLAQIHGNINRWGENAVLALIGECMAAGYRGIVFDRLEKRGGGRKPVEKENDLEWMKPYIRQRDKQRAPVRQAAREEDEQRSECSLPLAAGRGMRSL